MEQLPLILVFGIATSPSTIQQVLPHSVSSLLCIELFQSLSCTQHLSTVMDKVESPVPYVRPVDQVDSSVLYGALGRLICPVWYTR